MNVQEEVPPGKAQEEDGQDEEAEGGGMIEEMVLTLASAAIVWFMFSW